MPDRRTEAAQMAASDWEIFIAEDGYKAIRKREVRTLDQIALDVLTAADDTDAAARVVRVDMSDVAAMLKRIRRACGDPGSFVERKRWLDGGIPHEEPISEWSARAVVTALAGRT